VVPPCFQKPEHWICGVSRSIPGAIGALACGKGTPVFGACRGNPWPQWSTLISLRPALGAVGGDWPVPQALTWSQNFQQTQETGRTRVSARADARGRYRCLPTEGRAGSAGCPWAEGGRTTTESPQPDVSARRSGALYPLWILRGHLALVERPSPHAQQHKGPHCAVCLSAQDVGRSRCSASKAA